MARIFAAVIATGILLLPAMAAADEPTTQEDAILQLLAEAEKQAEASDEDSRTGLLVQIEEFYVKIGRLDKAKAIAARQNEFEAQYHWFAIAVAQSLAGDCQGALETASQIKAESSFSSSALMKISGDMADTDVQAAIELAGKIQKPYPKSLAYRRIAIKQIYTGKFDNAAKTASLIENADLKKETDSLILAGRLLAQEGDLAKAAADAGVKIDDISDSLRNIAEYKAAGGDIDPAEKALGALTEPTHRADLHICIAEQLFAKGDKDKFLTSAESAVTEMTKVNRDDELNCSFLSTDYVRLALLYAKAGYVDQAVKLVKQCEQADENDQIKKLTGRDSIFSALGGKLLIVNVYVTAGLPDEALAHATNEDGTMVRGSLPLLVAAYARAGRKDMVEKLIATAPKDSLCGLNIAHAAAILESREKEKK